MKTKYTLRGGPLHGRTVMIDSGDPHGHAIALGGAATNAAELEAAKGAVYVRVNEVDADGKRLPILQFLRMED